MHLKPEKNIYNRLSQLQKDIRHVKTDVDMIKAVIIEDTLLTKEEKAHIEKSMENLKKGKTAEFIPLNEI
ncbi:MAG: hypothetical protein HY362_01110 [Candidatus Aenigmarchaeota archaeon]|nr:hypothetical protein [Candidatus Aenigmarchaeota archaeon]